MNKEYYKNKKLPNVLISKDGDFVYETTKEKVYITKDNKPRLHVKVGKGYFYGNAARMVLETFNPIEDMNKFIVSYKDGNSKNIKYDNLEWISNSQNQINKFKKKQKLIPLPDYEIELGIYPNPIETQLYKNYYHIPITNHPFAINMLGEIIDLRTGDNKKISYTYKKYLFSNICINNSPASKYFFNKLISYNENKKSYYNNILIHRLVALLFCEVPDRHKGKLLSELQVNHKDGDKSNNTYTNLEWIDNNENMQHARKNNLFNNSKNVLARNIKTNNIIKFHSIQSCFEYFKNNYNCSFNVRQLRNHLLNKNYGMIVKNDHVFKFEDKTSWPEKLIQNPDYITISTICNVYAKNIITKNIYIFSSLAHAADYLKLNLNTIRLSRSRKGPEFPINNWLFGSLNNLPMSKKLKGHKR